MMTETLTSVFTGVLQMTAPGDFFVPLCPDQDSLLQ